MPLRLFLPAALLGAAFGVTSWAAAAPASPAKPNLVYILADDLGYGDVQALNPTRGKIKTPHLDRLAAEGRSFTDAHSGSSVCTPTRYGLLTGRYAWRTRLQKRRARRHRRSAAHRRRPPHPCPRCSGNTATPRRRLASGTLVSPRSVPRARRPRGKQGKRQNGLGWSAPRLADHRRSDYARLRLFLGLLERPHDVGPDSRTTASSRTSRPSPCCRGSNSRRCVTSRSTRLPRKPAGRSSSTSPSPRRIPPFCRRPSGREKAGSAPTVTS